MAQQNTDRSNAKYTKLGKDATGEYVARDGNENEEYIGVVKTIKKTIGGHWNTGECDLEFVSNGVNVTPENLDCGSIIPAWAKILDVTLMCKVAISASTFTFAVGNASAGEQFIAAAQGVCDAVNEVISVAANAASPILTANAAQKLWLQGTPGANWSTLTTGKWVVVITYLDLSDHLN